MEKAPLHQRKNFEIRIAEDPKKLALLAVQIFLDCARHAISVKNQFTVVLSGGETPRLFYESLAADPVAKNLPWKNIHFFWGDERNVPMNHPDSNFHLAWNTLLSRLPVPEKNIHRISTELPTPGLVAEAYEKEIRDFFNLEKPLDGPKFDLTFIGLGIEGHTGSIFPDGVPSLGPNEDHPSRLIIAPWIPHLAEFRFTLTPHAFNSSAEVVFLVSGKEKASIVKQIIDGSHRSPPYPAAMIRPSRGTLVWLIDAAAASLLKNGQQI